MYIEKLPVALNHYLTVCALTCTCTYVLHYILVEWLCNVLYNSTDSYLFHSFCFLFSAPIYSAIPCETVAFVCDFCLLHSSQRTPSENICSWWRFCEETINGLNRIIVSQSVHFSPIHPLTFDC